MADLIASASEVPDPSKPSGAYAQMAPDWLMIDTILLGARAVRAARETYLPKYEDESPEEYSRRLKTAPWRPEFADALRTLAAKPFGKDVTLGDKPSDAIKKIAADVDSRGNSLTAFSKEIFYRGIADGLHCILVDYPTMQPGVTLAAEKAAGARPYWVHINATNLIALYTKTVKGKEVVAHARIKETSVKRVGFTETTVDRVRVLDLDDNDKPIWSLWEKQKNPTTGKEQFVEIDGGTISIDQIPLVPYFTGERLGEHLVKPPLVDLAVMQIELYQALSRQDEILTFAGSPMLAANGMGPPADGSGVAVGPKRVLFAPPGPGDTATSWEFVQPDAGNLKEVREHVKSITDDMRRLGMQPMVEINPTATGAAIDAEKAHSAVQAWAIGLKDALEQAFVLTTQWMKVQEAVEVTVDTDFDVSPYEDVPVQAIDKARARRDLSLPTFWNEYRRRGILGPGFDPAAEQIAVDAEIAALEAKGLDPITGQSLDKSNGKPAPSLNIS